MTAQNRVSLLAKQEKGYRLISRMKPFLPAENFPPAVIGCVTDRECLPSLSSSEEILPCDAVELRIDALTETVSCDEILSLRFSKPVLVTVRRREEGGMRDIDESERRDTARRLLPIAAALDWEIAAMPTAAALLSEAHQADITVVASAHDFQKTPALETMQVLERQARSMGADVVKFAFRLNSPDDLLIGAELLKQRTGPMAVMGMGPLGPVSRMFYAQLGSSLVYGYLGNRESAPGQWEAALFQKALRRLVPFYPKD